MAPIRCPFTSCKWTVLNGTTARKLRHLGNCSSCGFIWLTILLNSQMFYSFVFWPLIRIPPLNHSLTLYSDAISHEIILLPVRKKNIFAIGILWFLSTFTSYTFEIFVNILLIPFATGTIFRTVPSTGKPLQMPALQVCICWTKHWFSSYTPSPFSCKVISFFMNFFFNVPIIFVFLSCWSGSLYDKRPTALLFLPYRALFWIICASELVHIRIRIKVLKIMQIQIRNRVGTMCFVSECELYLMVNYS